MNPIRLTIAERAVLAAMLRRSPLGNNRMACRQMAAVFRVACCAFAVRVRLLLLRAGAADTGSKASCAPSVAGRRAVLAAVTWSSGIEPAVVAVVAAAQQPGRKLQRAALADAVVHDGAAVVQLLARVGQVLVANCLAVLVLHLAFDTADSV